MPATCFWITSLLETVIKRGYLLTVLNACPWRIWLVDHTGYNKVGTKVWDINLGWTLYNCAFMAFGHSAFISWLLIVNICIRTDVSLSKLICVHVAYGLCACIVKCHYGDCRLICADPLPKESLRGAWLIPKPIWGRQSVQSPPEYGGWIESATTTTSSRPHQGKGLEVAAPIWRTCKHEWIVEVQMHVLSSWGSEATLQD